MGFEPIAMVSTTVFVSVFITDILFAPKFVTYAKPPSEVMAIPKGALSTDIVSTTVLVAVFSQIMSIPYVISGTDIYQKELK